jgi:hypothetical protein
MKLARNNRTKTDCGVIAALNAARWSGLKYSYKRVFDTAVSAGYSPEKGIYFFQFSNLLKKIGVKAKRIRPKSSNEMVDRVDAGKMLVIFYIPTGFDVGHVMSCVLDHNGDVKVINPEPNSRRTWIQLLNDIKENGMKEFRVYEITPYGRKVTVASRDDDTRTA